MNFKATAFAVVDGIDGRVRRLKLPEIEAAGDGPDRRPLWNYAGSRMQGAVSGSR